MGSSQIRRTGEGGRIGANRKKSEPEKRRMKAAGGGKMVPAKAYKDRKDIGSQRQRSDREQQPTKKEDLLRCQLETNNARQRWKKSKKSRCKNTNCIRFAQEEDNQGSKS